MSINSIQYLIFILGVVIVYYLFPKKYRFIMLLVSSYIFYFLASKQWIIYLLFSTLSIYLGGLLLDKQNKIDIKNLEKEEKKKIKRQIKSNKKRIVFWIVFFNFALLIGLKYGAFLTKNLNHLLSFSDISLPVVKLVLPLGISYYTLMAVSYIVDVYRNTIQADHNLGRVALYLAYFPHITEGPIGKYKNLANQLYEGHEFKIKQLQYGATYILFGFFKKMVIADRAAIFVNDVFASTNGGFTIFMAALMYTIQIYAEFSGCMDIVRGTSELLGIHLERNFFQPFFSTSVQEFWRRWHITLGAWIKDYIFYPISLSKMNQKVSEITKKWLKNKHLQKFILTAFPLLFVWLFNGFWHGASYKYIAYGLYYYFVMMLGLLFFPMFDFIRKKLHISLENKLYKLYAMIRTSFFVIIGMFLFRSKSLHQFIVLFKNMLFKPYTGIMNHGLVRIDYLVLALGIVILLILGIAREKKISIYSFIQKHLVLQYVFYLFLILMIVVFGIYGEGYQASDFIYGAF